GLSALRGGETRRQGLFARDREAAHGRPRRRQVGVRIAGTLSKRRLESRSGIVALPQPPCPHYVRAVPPTTQTPCLTPTLSRAGAPSRLFRTRTRARRR